MTSVKMHAVTQGSDEWIALRCGLITASTIKHIVTPATRQPADNDKQRAHLYELLAQRISGYVEPSFVSDDMAAGYDGEIIARGLYAHHFAPVTECGFITNDRWGFTLGYSPDGLVGEDGLIEIKTHRQKGQIKTIIEDYAEASIPAEHALQVQAGLLIAERAWCDYISYSPGLPMVVTRAFPDEAVQSCIIAAARDFERRLAERLTDYQCALAGPLFDSRTSHIAQTERVTLGDIAA